MTESSPIIFKTSPYISLFLQDFLSGERFEKVPSLHVKLQIYINCYIMKLHIFAKLCFQSKKGLIKEISSPF